MWGQTFYTLTPTLQTLTRVPLGFLKPLLNTIEVDVAESNMEVVL